MKFTSLVLYPLLIGCTHIVSAQVEINAAEEYTPAEIEPVHKTGLGISGPGKPVEGDGVLGMVSGTLLTRENRAKMASGKTVKDGLIPHIKPIWDVHLRDTDIISRSSVFSIPLVMDSATQPLHSVI